MGVISNSLIGFEVERLSLWEKETGSLARGCRGALEISYVLHLLLFEQMITTIDRLHTTSALSYTIFKIYVSCFIYAAVFKVPEKKEFLEEKLYAVMMRAM